MAKEKLYYKIGEACKILDIQPYVLRYWETEFSILSPSKSKSGQRVYDEEDFALIRRIKELLYDEGFTIAGAKKKLETEIGEGAGREPGRSPSPPAAPARTAAERKSDTKTGSRTAAAATEAKELVRLRTGVDKALTQALDILDFLEQ